VTAVLLVSGNSCDPIQPQSTTAAYASLAHRQSPSVLAPAAINVCSRIASSVSLSPAPDAAAIVQAAPSHSPAKAAEQFLAPTATTLQEGSRVCIAGLQVKPQHNGRTGVVCSAFDQESGRWTVAVEASDAGPTFQISIRPSNLVLLSDIDMPQCLPPPSALPNNCSPPPKAVERGSRVRIEGLLLKPQLNSRTGIVCGDFDHKAGRWTVDIDADGSKPSYRGSFRAANLRLIASHNFSTEWVDEGGRVWPKNVDFSRQCAKGHALAPLGDRGGLAGVQLMCRLCHCFRGCDCHDADSWLVCSEDVGCCAEYAVCSSCAHSPITFADTYSGSDDFRTLVSFRVAELNVLYKELTLAAARRGCVVPVVAEVDAGLVAGPHDHVTVLPAICAPIHLVQSRQRDGAADGAGRRCAACRRGDVVHQPHVEQRVFRHA
jgi:hypothetical protein